MLGLLPFSVSIEKEWVIRLPVFLNLLTAVAALLVACRMTESRTERVRPARLREVFRETNALASGTLTAGKWILREPAALLLLLVGVAFDSIVRLFLTLASEYYRLLDIDPGWFGVIGAGMAMLGFALSGVMERMAAKGSPLRNFQIVGAMILFGSLSLGFPMAIWGVFLVLPLALAIRFTQFFLSHYLNEVTESHQRATVLSFRGVSLNIGYGLAMGVFGLVSVVLPHLPAFAGAAPDRIFGAALLTIPLLFVLLLAALVAVKQLVNRRPLDELVAEARLRVDAAPDETDS